MEINGVRYNCIPGDTILMNTRAVRAFFGSSYYMLAIHFSHETLKMIVSKCEYAPKQMYNSQNSRVFRFLERNEAISSLEDYSHLIFTETPHTRSEAYHDRIRGNIHAYATALLRQETGWRFELLYIMSRIITLLEDREHMHCTDISRTMPKDELLYYDILRLMAETHGRISRTELAACVSFSENHVAAVVRRFCGGTVRQPARSFVIEEAQRLLRDTSMSINEIMDRLGYSGKTHFYETFAGACGCTPLAYRNGLQPNKKSWTEGEAAENQWLLATKRQPPTTA